MLRYVGIALGVLGESAILTPLVASIANNAGWAAVSEDQAYLAAGLGLVAALLGLVIWVFCEISAPEDQQK